MKKHLTLLAAAGLAVASLSAQAQITLDGKVDAAEVATTYTANKYQLVSTYNGSHSVAGLGFQQLYVAASATKLYVAVVGAYDQATTYPSLVGYLNVPGKTGVAARTKLAGGAASDSPLKQKPTMDFEVDYGFRITFAPTGNANAYISYADYTSGNAAPVPDTYQGNPQKTGAPFTATATTGPFQNWRVAYLPATSVTANSANNAVEFEFDMTALGLTSTSRVDMFLAYTNDGGIFTSDTFPPIAGQTAALQPDQDFTTISGLQVLSYQVGTGALATKSANEVALGVYPNPSADRTFVSYSVAAPATPVQVSLLDLMGRTVRVVENGVKAAGQQSTSVSTADLAAGTYLVRVQVGDNVATSKVSVL